MHRNYITAADSINMPIILTDKKNKKISDEHMPSVDCN